MSTVATTTTHPALVLRHAVDTITTELVRADIAPTSLSITPHSSGAVTVSIQLGSRADFDSAASLFGPVEWSHNYDGSNGERRALFYVASFMGITIQGGAPASDMIPADCESAIGTV